MIVFQHDPAKAARNHRLNFSKGGVGKCCEAATAEHGIVVIDADLVESFPTPEAVNAALRSLKEIALRTGKPAGQVFCAK